MGGNTPAQRSSEGINSPQPRSVQQGEASPAPRAPSVQTSTLSLFEFEGLPDRAWAFVQMGLAHWRMRRTPHLTFYKLVGSGRGAGFDPRPNWGCYGILCAWESSDAAREGLANHPVITRWGRRAVRARHITLEALSVRGSWSGQTPFVPNIAADSDPQNAQVKPEVATKIAVLTRATLRLSVLARFWERVPAISDQIKQAPGCFFSVGIGEVPLKHQITFSLWDNLTALDAFGKGEGPHGAAVRSAYAGHWFKDQLFARFRLVSDETITHLR